MMPRRWPWIWLIMAIAVMFAVPFAAKAQAISQAVINFVEAIDTPDKNGLTLNVYFTLQDSTKHAIPNATVDKASLVLDPVDGGIYDATVAKATGPITIVLALDTSGSMTNAMKTMIAAATNVVSTAPQGSKFGVIQFSDKVNIIAPITDDKNAVTQAISQIKAGGSTCLFDAAYQAVNTLSSAPPGRRAVIVFTDGKDETAAGKICSTHTVNDVVSLATTKAARAPIYTIGLQGSQPIAEADLHNMSDGTGGETALGKDPTALFQQIITSLNSQLVASALVFPTQGERHVSLRLTSGSAAITDVSDTFTSPKDYSIKPTATPTITPTPLPVSLVIKSIQQDPQTKEFLVDVSVVDEALISSYTFDLISPLGTTQSTISKTPPLSGAVRVPFGDLVSGDYSIRVSALDKDGRLIARSEDAPIHYQPTPTITPTLTVTPLPVGVTIDTITYVDPTVKDKLQVNLKLTAQNQIASLRASLSNADSGITIRDFATLPVGPQVTLDVGGVPGGNYNVTVYAYDANGTQLSSNSQKFNYDFVAPTPTPTPTPLPSDPLSQLSLALKDPARAPVVLGVIGVFVLAVILLLVILVVRRPKKAATGTGFLREMTGAVDVSELSGYAKGASSSKAAKPAAASSGRAGDKTMPMSKIPDASVVVERSRDTANLGKTVPVLAVPFTMGRRERDLNFENDPGVSREHAQITYQNNAFFITDNGSTNHTFVDESEIPANQPRQIYNGASIRLGTSTVLTFRTSAGGGGGSGGFDRDKTMPEGFNLK